MSHPDGISNSTAPSDSTQTESSATSELLDVLTAKHFGDWYRERQYRLNIENGTPYFNGSGHVPDAERHSPSQLLQCHRKIVYRQCNAPAEEPDPDGIFWVGTRFEKQLAFPFLERAVTDSQTYVQNEIWIDFLLDSNAGDLRIKGVTDPVIVDQDAIPILPTEIKTKSTIENLTSPNLHHKAQLHAYMHGLSEKYDTDLTEGVLIYGSRETLDVQFFHVEFDHEFWNEVVLAWARRNTEYRLENDLPPPDPQFEWECKFCEYRERCGKGNSKYADEGVAGLLPNITSYPREKVEEYLEAHDGARLTPTLAEKYPDLATQYGVMPWRCPECSSSFDWDQFGQDGAGNSLCPKCATEDFIVELRVPQPADQLSTLRSVSNENERSNDE